MVYFEVLGHHFLILGTFERTTDLLEKRSSNYSDRMRLPMMIDLYVSVFFCISNFVKRKLCFRMGWGYNFSVMPYGVPWRRRRRSFHNFFNINVVSKYMPIQRREVHAFLRRLLDTPDNFFHHIRQ